MPNDPLIIVLAGLLVLLVLLIGYAPGHIARSRQHPQASAIAVCGWLSLLLWPLWFVAIIWAFVGTPAPRRQVRRTVDRGARMTRSQWDAVDALENMR